MRSTIAARITGSVAFFHEFQEKPEFLLISIKRKYILQGYGPARKRAHFERNQQ